MKKGHGTATVMRHKCRLKIGDPFNFTKPICCILIAFFHTFLPLILVPESSNGLQFSAYRPHTEIPVHEVEKYRYRYTGFEFGPVPITTDSRGQRRMEKRQPDVSIVVGALQTYPCTRSSCAGCRHAAERAITADHCNRFRNRHAHGRLPCV